MKTLNKLVFILPMIFVFESQAQFYEHEFSANLGFYQLRSDYGISDDSETNFGNQGLALSLSYYYNPAFRNRKSYFQDHFKYRFNLQFSSTDLEHYIPESDDPRLASMTGSYTNFGINNGLEYYPLKIKTIKSYRNKSFLYDISPYVGVGLGVNFVKPDAESSLSGGLSNIDNILLTFISNEPDNGINLDSDTVLSFNFRAGLRYKLDIQSEIVLESSWMFFDSDFVDGLSPVGPQNKNKDWSWGINIGYSYLLF
ncbi:hypothetical protein [Flavobacterium sp. CS20]|uniref:THC0290_0291 family protein n=1 Tax=Flavobacterium sp. CS20 TaxID=2775246 RepID=UPI001B3A78A5|nr:hypothetical protein [Flavobacterium sp. CS20]QTY26022.1 hypothetical protein IGB25_08400 [Flavobacterium sp. CS20]